MGNIQAREELDIYDIHGNKNGKTVFRGDHIGKDEYIMIVDVWIKNSAGEYLISRRAPWKKPEAGCWEPTCGCASKGDDSLAAALREVREELGIDLEPQNAAFYRRLIFEGKGFFVDVWLFNQEVDLDDVVMQAEEVDAVKWAATGEILDMQKERRFIREYRMPYIADLSAWEPPL